MAVADGVLLLGYGGPEKPSEVRSFVEAIVGRTPAYRQAVEAVVGQYRRIGGRSPYNEEAFRFGDSLARALAARGHSLPVSVGFLHGRPGVEAALLAAARRGRRRLLALILTPFESQTSWGRPVRGVYSARRRLLARAPSVSFLPGWSRIAGYHEALADRIREACPRWRKGRDRLVFTAHAIPLADAGRSRYAGQLAALARSVSRRVGIGDAALAYQSRPLASRARWTGPDLREVLRRAGQEGISRVVVCPAGFPLENKEILYDLDVVARREAASLGLRFARARAAGDHPRFVGAFARRIIQSSLPACRDASELPPERGAGRPACRQAR